MQLLQTEDVMILKLFKESKPHIHPKITAVIDTGYKSTRKIRKIHNKPEILNKNSKKNYLTKEDK